MREVDEALARAYAERSVADQPQGVPPAPICRLAYSSQYAMNNPKQRSRSSCSGLHSSWRLNGIGVHGSSEWRNFFSLRENSKA